MASSVGRPSARHCWVIGMYGRSEAPIPGLLLNWRQDDEGKWWGHIAFAFPARLGPTVQVAWVNADHLRDISPPPARPKP